MQLNRAHAPLRGARAAGFTLLEVLAALLVLNVGLLGMASLALGGLHDSRIALQHTQATALLADLADRIRANRRAGPAYALAAGVTLDAPALSCAAVGECSAAAMAAFDLYAWQAEVAATLPEAETAVTVAAAAVPGVYDFVIAVRWRQSGDAMPASAGLTVRT